MGLYRDYQGKIVDTTDERARSMGYEPVTIDEQAETLQQQGIEEGKEERAEGAVKTFVRGLGSGVTLGLTDVFTGAVASDNLREDIVAGMEAHPIARTAGEVVGSLAPILPGVGGALRATPAGYLSQQTAKIAGKGGAKAMLGAAGVEGAVQNAGQYIGHAALEDKEVTVEGLAGAAGLGFAFGAAGGGVALGIEKGTIAARRMFARVADGGKDAATNALSEWETKSRTILDADESNALAARAKLEEYSKARAAAQGDNLRAKRNLEYERSRPGDAAKAAPEDVPMEFTVDEALPAIGAEKPGPRRAPQVDRSEPFTMPESMSVGDDIAETAAPQLGDDAFTPPPGPWSDGRVTVGPTGEPLTLDGVDIHQMVKEMQRRTTSGEKFRGMGRETISDYRARQPQPDGIRIGIKKTGSYKDDTYVTTDGRTLTRNEITKEIEKHLPKGFRAGAIDLKNVSVHKGVPADDAFDSSAIYVVRPRDLAKRELFGNELKAGGVESIDDAFSKGTKLEPLQIDVDKNGTFFIEDGNHRLMSAVKGDREIAVRFRRQQDGWQPQSGARKINDQVVPPPETLPPFDPAEGRPWVSQKQSVAGLKNVRETFGKLTRQERPVLGKAMDAEFMKLEEALAEFNAAKVDLADHISETAMLKRVEDMRSGSGDLPATVVSDGRKLSPDEYDYLQGNRGDSRPLSAADKTAVVKGKTVKELDVRAMEDIYEDALARAENAADDVERAAAMSDADAIKVRLDEADTLPDNLIGDVAKAAEAFQRYEKASAELADVLGDAAHPGSLEHAKAYTTAQDESVRRAMDRMTRAAEDAETFGPQRFSKKDRVNNAKEYKAQTASEVAAAKEAEKLAREEAKRAGDRFKATKKSLADEKKQMFPKATQRGGAAEAGGLYEMIDIPGMPKIGDLPVVGPLMSAWLKYRTVKAAYGRFTGRIPATADTKAAALAAKTKDRVAKSIDKSLGFVTEKAAKAKRPAAIVSVALSRQIFDDGGDKTAKGKDDIQGNAADRIREIAAYVSTPGAIERDVRRELQDVTDPDLIAAAEKHRRMVMQHLLDKSPKAPPHDPLNPRPFKPSVLDSMALGRRLAVVDDPASAFEALNKGGLTLEAADTLRTAFPRLFQLGQQRLLMKAGQLKEQVPYRTRVMMSMLFDVPLDRSLDPRNIRIMQSVYAPTASQMPGAPVNMPSPSVAGDVTINALYQTAADRSMSRR